MKVKVKPSAGAAGAAATGHPGLVRAPAAGAATPVKGKRQKKAKAVRAEEVQSGLDS